MTLYASTRSPGTVVVTVAFQAVTAPWTRLPVASRNAPALTPVKEAPAISPCVTEPEKVAVRTVPDASPSGASADAIAAWSLLSSRLCTSTVQVSAPPVTDVSVRAASFQTTNANTRDPVTAAAFVVSAIVVPAALSVLAPRLLSNAIDAPPLVVPVPERATACGLPGALSVTLTFALRLPVAVGLKLTVIVQVALTASDAGQSFVCVKSPGFVPVRAMPLIVSGAVPVFCSVDVCGALVEPIASEPNARLAGVRVTLEAVPVPVRVTLCGLPTALSVIATLALRLPVAVGLNATVIVHVAFAARVAGQSFACVKSPGFAPVRPTLVMVSEAVPVFLSVDVCDVLVEPTTCEAKARLAGVSVTAGA